MKSVLKTVCIATMLGFYGVTAFALSTPDFPAGPASSPNPSAINVHPPVVAGGQWFDTYFPANPGGLDGQAIANASCIVVFYHGGSFFGGTPRTLLDPNMVVHFVQQRNCIFIASSYSTNPPNSQSYTIPQIIGTPATNQSVFGSFNAIYTQYLQGWMQANPNIKLWTAGESAGTVLAQRVAASGNWPVTNTLLVAPVVKAPTYHGYTTPDGQKAIGHPLDSTCGSRDRDGEAGCNALRFLFGYNPIDWAQNWAQSDLAYYATSTPSTVQTNVVINACDEYVDLGSFMRGYLNHISPANRRISVHRGYSIGQINSMYGGPDPAGTYLRAQHNFLAPMAYQYYQNYTNSSAPNSDWVAFNATSLPEIGSQYINYCQPVADDAFFRAKLIN